MSPFVLARLGEGDYAEGHRVMFALLDDKAIFEVIAASNEDEALARARELAGERGVDCEPLLEALARRRRASTQAPTAFQKMLKAHAALRLFAKDTYVGRQDAAVMDFLEAAYVFSRAIADDARPQWHVAATARGTVAERAVDRELFLLVEPGTEPRFVVLSRTDADWVFANDAEVTRVDRMVIEFASDPALDPIVEDAYGVQSVPHVIVVESGARRPADDLDLEFLAACMGTIGRHVAAKAVGLTYSPLLGGELDIKLSTYVRS